MIDLKALRAEKNLTQQQLADEIHCVRTVIANIERGTARPSIATAKALADALGVNWWEFFDEECDANGTDPLHGPGSGEALKN